MEGLRAGLAEEFTSLYIFNLRGNARTSGEQRRMEKGNVFGEGSRTPVAISILVRNPAKTRPGEIHYYDIGDYLSREEKLSIIAQLGSLNGLHREKKWVTIQPNANHDWINQRDPIFERFISLGDKKDDAAQTVFESYSSGLKTGRDTWCYNFSSTQVSANMRSMVGFYNQQATAFQKQRLTGSRDELVEAAQAFVDNDPKKISWGRGLINDLSRGTKHQFVSSAVRSGLYRPFCKQAVYFDRPLNDMVYQLYRLFPTPQHENLAICLTGVGNRLGFSTILTDSLPDLHMADQNGASQCFPLYLYDEDQPPDPGELIAREQDGELISGFRRRSAITTSSLNAFRSAYGTRLSAEDVFYYVYGLLHSPEYRRRFGSDLKKMLPRLPLTREPGDFERFCKAGRDLARWHLHYESVEPWPLQEHFSALSLDSAKDFLVTKMVFGRPSAAQKADGEKFDRTVIHFNASITLSGIPLEAYDYVVNGKSAIEWIMERYQVTVDKDSGIKNDPNDWAREHNQPRYIIDLVKRVVRVSMETNRIVAQLPALNERTTS